MARLYDRIRTGGVYYPANMVNVDDRRHHRINQGLEQAEVFEITNVADYFFGRDRDRSGQWKMQEFPNIAPPFPAYFVEFSVSPLLRPWRFVKNAGVLFLANDWEEGDLNDPAGQPRWVCEVYLLGESLATREERGALCMAVISYVVGIDGRMLRWEDGYFAGQFLGTTPYREGEEMATNALKLVSYEHLYPALLSHSFLHCKNVRRVENVPPPKLSRAYEKRHGRPLVKYYTLEIDPMKEVLRREGQSETVGLKRALSICRGHFKTYDEKPLFGKIKGTFWWPMHVTGNVRNGVIVKDYAVNAPSKPVGSSSGH